MPGGKWAADKLALHAGFLLMGFGFTVTQGLMVRELLVAFFGNELCIGLVLGNWLILEAAGSGLLGRLAPNKLGSPECVEDVRTKTASFALLQVLLALFLPLCLYGAYVSRRIAGAVPGEGVGLAAIWGTSLLILAPLALVDGAMFAWGCRAYAALTGQNAPTVGCVYVYEALGAIAGGIVFTYLLIPFLQSLRIVLLLSVLNLLSATLLLAFSRASSGRCLRSRQGCRLPHTPSLPHTHTLHVGSIVVLVLLAASLALLFSPWVRAAQRWAAGQQWPGYNLLYSENSAYGNVAVVQRDAQYTFFADGIPILTAPVPDVALVEEVVHLPMLFVPRTRRALVLSGGLGGVLRELLKYPWQRVDYAELDPLLIEAVQQFPTPLTRSELSDPRVRVELVDGRLLVGKKGWDGRPADGNHPPGRGLGAWEEEGGEGYDLVIVNLPYPSTLQLNRFYTAEFYRLVRALLAEEGVLVVSCPGTLTYMSEELHDLNAMVYRTLREAFPHVRPIPGEWTLWLASPAEAVETLPLEVLVGRWAERGLEAQLMTPFHIRLRLDPGRLDWFWASLEVDGMGGEVNRDLHPVGLYQGLRYWNALFAPHVARAFAAMGRLNAWMLGALIAGGGLAFLAVVRWTGRGGDGSHRKDTVIPVAIAVTGFTGMVADLIVVFAFQTLYGYVYHWIGLLVTAFMGGLSAGGLLMTRRLPVIWDRRAVLLRIEAALVLYWALLPVALSALYGHAAYRLATIAVQGILLLLNALAGLLVGAQFPLANAMWLEGRQVSGGTAGVLYACDLVGAFLGSIAVSVVLIPVLGILETCALAAVLKLCSLVLIVLLVPRLKT